MLKNKFLPLLVAGFAFASLSGSEPVSAQQSAAQPSKLWNGLAKLAPNVLVVVGRGAPAQEQQAAQDIAAALRASGGPADNLVDDDAAFANLDRAATSHLILVGTFNSNEMLRQQWGHWAIDRAAFFKTPVAPDGRTQPGFYLDGEGRDMGTPRTGFYVNSFGTFSGPATGYIESSRNDLSLVPSALAETVGTTPLKLCIKITGYGSAGVARAATIFLRTAVLGAVLPATDEALPENGDAFLLSKARYVRQLPAWIPRDQLLGWILPDAGDYAGFLQSSGQPAMQIWRAKYLPAGEFTTFQELPHRRSSDDELFVAQMASPTAAKQAMDQMAATLSDAKVLYENKMNFVATPVGGKPAWKDEKEGVHFVASGNFVLMETLPEPRGLQLLETTLKAMP